MVGALGCAVAENKIAVGWGCAASPRRPRDSAGPSSSSRWDSTASIGPTCARRDGLLLDPALGAEPRPPLLEDDRALLFDLGAVEGQAGRPVLEDQKRLVEHGGVVGRDGSQ